MPKPPDPLRAVLEPLLPEGVDFETLHPLVEDSSTKLDEALDPLAALAAKATEKALERRKGILGPAAYRRALRVQDELRQSYSRGLDAILADAVKLGPNGREKLLGRFGTLARSHLERSHRLGMRLTATGATLKAQDGLWTRYLDERASHDRLHFLDFLNTIWEGKEKMPRDQRRDLYTNNLDSMFNQGAITGAPGDVVITWRLCITTPESRVLTRRGWVPIAEVVVGDEVWTHRARWRPVTENVVRVKWSEERVLEAPSGAQVGCTSDHTWMTSAGWKCHDHIAETDLSVYTLHDDQLRGIDRGPVPSHRASRSEAVHGELLDRGWKAHRGISASMEMGAGQRTDPPGVCSSPQKRGQDRRSSGEPGASTRCRASQAPCERAVPTGCDLRSVQTAIPCQEGQADGQVLLLELPSVGHDLGADLSSMREAGAGAAIEGGPPVLFPPVCEQRQGGGESAPRMVWDITVQEDHSFVIEGLTSSNSPSEHCYDCIGLAAQAHYSKPGAKSDLPPLPTVPRRGDTQCLARCKCYLTYNSETTGESLDPVEKAGVAIEEPEDADEPLPSERRVEIQQEADQLQRDMLYYKAQSELTGGERKWIDLRKEANERLIELQGQLGPGGRFVPRSTSDAMLRAVEEAQDGGWGVASASDAAKFTSGQYAAVVEGTNFHRGLLVEWDAETGEGLLETLGGDTLTVGTKDEIPTIMLGRRLAEIPAKPWQIVNPPIQDAVVADVPGRANVVAEVVPASSKVDTSGVMKAAREALEARPHAENHGVNVWVMPPKGRTWKPDPRTQFGRGGVELIGEKVIALRGAAKLNTKPGSVEVAVHQGVGARIFESLEGSPYRTRWRREMSRFVESFGEDLRMVIAVPEEQANFALAYQLFITDTAALLDGAPGVSALLEEVVLDLDTGVLAL